MSKVTLRTLRRYKEQGEKFACATAYDASFARRLDEAGVELLLVGDSLGMVVQGREDTLPVTLDEMVYHTQIVRRGSGRALVMADMPFLSHSSPEQALAGAARLIKEGGAHVVKIEANQSMLPTVEHLANQGVPVCGHLGLLPQWVNKIGGYRVQGRDPDQAEAILRDAVAIERAGADLLLLECVPRDLARRVAEQVSIPLIGIGAGPDCDAQVLVLYDLLGITSGKLPSFVKNFMAEAADIPGALAAYVAQVKDGRFPSPEHTFD